MEKKLYLILFLVVLFLLSFFQCLPFQNRADYSSFATQSLTKFCPRVLVYQNLNRLPTWKRLCPQHYGAWEKENGGHVTIWEVSCDPVCQLRALLSDPQLMQDGGSYLIINDPAPIVPFQDRYESSYEEQGDEGLGWWVVPLIISSGLVVFLFSKSFPNSPSPPLPPTPPPTASPSPPPPSLTPTRKKSRRKEKGERRKEKGERRKEKGERKDLEMVEERVGQFEGFEIMEVGEGEGEGVSSPVSNVSKKRRWFERLGGGVCGGSIGTGAGFLAKAVAVSKGGGALASGFFGFAPVFCAVGGVMVGTGVVVLIRKLKKKRS